MEQPRVAGRGGLRRTGEGTVAQTEPSPDGHPGAYLDGRGLFPQVAGPVRQAGGVVGVRRMPAPSAPKRGGWLLGVPTDPDDPYGSIRVGHGSHLQCAIKALPGDLASLGGAVLFGL
ncbi:hypothetical protein GCM10010140_20960 [Streptosporangium pseudovulgare]|uniref:Uncharacterized protein n=1 Tax=Streptosporangium pseudovulgare TaxID=35765 RepID=A0ABQ2QQD3_9ACTN|nr:hypothetical protein GCM10010140_20960 [Streptosporangium pseudovulgare]